MVPYDSSISQCTLEAQLALYLNFNVFQCSPTTSAVVLTSLPSVPVTDTVSNVMYFTLNWMTVVIIAMLCVIVTCRLYDMYQRSRKMLIFLIVIFLLVTITCGVVAAILNSHVSAEEYFLSGTYLCNYEYDGAAQLLIPMTWLLCTIWEVLVLCLVARIVVKHFRERTMGWTVVECFTVLIKTPMVYFVISIAVSSLNLGYFSPKLSNSLSVGSQVYYGVWEVSLFLQMFVLGPRLILNVREYHAKRVVDFDALTTIVFQEHDHVSAGSDV
ncbi:uncharacterized protein EDB91DRAFT_631358 [Suillus paluster]|uniref:uncharacterized protein n=1 Tax=Suillus paluster TaxID=48578 RepID=UPI001B8648AC|nr:uncharacterized protein EDB91DRAFT_631358 [Suillus paluster]KAG1733588.1 hypothetical protein EDB91DRAFT_631358 [Suillus paluster]